MAPKRRTAPSASTSSGSKKQPRLTEAALGKLQADLMGQPLDIEVVGDEAGSMQAQRFRARRTPP